MVISVPVRYWRYCSYRRHRAQLMAAPLELEDFAVAVATDHLSVADIAQWLRRHTTDAPTR